MHNPKERWVKVAEPKKTPLYDEHVKLGAKMIEFVGWWMPVQYTSIIEEHMKVRKEVGLFDVSHMGEIIVEGPDAFKFLQRLVTNDVGKAVGNRVVYSPMCYPDGGTVDDLLIYPQGENKYLLVVNAANTDKDYEWMKEQAAGMNVEIKNISPEVGQIAIQGPKALEVLQSITDVDLAPMKFYTWTHGKVAGIETLLISRTGYTGEDGFEVYVEASKTPEIWRKLLEVGKTAGIAPCGLGARDTLRFEASLPLYGHELSPTISPLEAGLDRFVALEKGDFIGREALLAQKQNPKRQLVGLEMIDRGIPRQDYPVTKGGKEIGQVTSGSYCAYVNKNLANALVAYGSVNVGDEVEVVIRGKGNKAKVVPLPFYKRGK